jgi:hypothetical protein
LHSKHLVCRPGFLRTVGAPALSKEKKSMDPMYDLNSWSKQRREEALREAQRRSLAKQGIGDRRTPFKLGGVGSALSSVLGLLR